MFPYRDDNPTLASPLVTFLLIGANVAMWVVVQGMGAEPSLSRSVCELGLIPGEFLGRVPQGATVPMGPQTACVLGTEQTWFTPLTSMFLHGGWFHLIGNMWFLWVFGNNVEDSMGRFRYLAFYLLCGLAAALSQLLVDPASQVPMIGASGAISGVIGAYLVLHPHAPIKTLVFHIIVALPAFVVLGLWILFQLAYAFMSPPGAAGVAWWAHVGGFFAGVILIFVMRYRDVPLFDRHA
jgi:membrane associated rhomboid family serine protease